MTQNTRHKIICLIAHQSPHRQHCEGCREPWNHTPASGAGYHGIRSWWRPDGSVLSQQHLWFHNILSHCWNLLLPEKKTKKQKSKTPSRNKQSIYILLITFFHSLPARQACDWAGPGREPKRKHPVHTGSCWLGVTWRRIACWRCTKPTWRTRITF